MQGVGFRPFIYRLADELSLTGWVTNTTDGVVMEVEGRRSDLETFLFRLERDAPPLAKITSLHSEKLQSRSYPYQHPPHHEFLFGLRIQDHLRKADCG